MKLPSLLFSLGVASLFSIAACGGSAESASIAAPAEDEDAPFGDEVKTKTDVSIQHEIEEAATGATFTSESDYPFKVVNASLPDGTRSITQELVREKLAWVVDHDPDADKPLARLNGMTSTFASWKSDTANCHEDEAPGPEDCAKIQKMNAALERNLRGIKVFYFGSRGSAGQVDGTAVSVIVVGRTPKGNLVGVRTIAIWT